MLLTVGALLLATVGLTVANAVQGPRLLSAQFDAAGSVQRVGQRLVLQVDQAVADVGGLRATVTPTAPVAVSAEGTSLVLRFDTSLRYATPYTVTLPVRSATTGATGTLHYSFSTPAGSSYLLQRVRAEDAGQPDQIVRNSITGQTDQVVYREPRIEQFAVAEPELAAVALTGDQVGRLTVGRTDGSGPTRTLAENSTITQLKASGPGGMFGYVITAAGGAVQNQLQLKLYNPLTGGEPITVNGLDGKSLEPSDWAFVPGTTSIVAQTVDSSIYLIDPVHHTPIRPLGGHLRMYGFVPGTTTLVVEDVNHFTTINLATGSTKPLTNLPLPKGAAISRLLPLGAGLGYVGLLASLDADTNLQYAVATVGAGAPRTLYATKPAISWVQNVCVSPNRELAAVEEVPASAQSDSYDFVPGYPGIMTVFIDIASGRVTARVPGFDGNWCN